MNKLLISLLSLTGVAGLSTSGYFLLRNSKNGNRDSKTTTDKQENGGGAGVGALESPGKPSNGRSDSEQVQSPSQPPSNPQPRPPAEA